MDVDVDSHDDVYPSTSGLRLTFLSISPHLYTMCTFANCSHYTRKSDAIDALFLTNPKYWLCGRDRTLRNTAYMAWSPHPEDQRRQQYTALTNMCIRRI